jgi:hypothetical protein
MNAIQQSLLATYYFRITFSEGVMASAYKGLENKRSAYFSIGAAWFCKTIP